MKRLTLLVIFSLSSMFSVYSFAEEKENAEKLAEHKKEVLEHIEKQIATFTKAKECVTAAQTKDAMKACHEMMMKEHKEMMGMKRGGRGHGMHDEMKK